MIFWILFTKVYAWLTNKYIKQTKIVFVFRYEKKTLFGFSINFNTSFIIQISNKYHLIRIKGVFFYILIFRTSCLLLISTNFIFLLFPSLFYFIWVKKQPIKVHFSMILALLTVVTKQHRIRLDLYRALIPCWVDEG